MELDSQVQIGTAGYGSGMPEIAPPVHPVLGLELLHCCNIPVPG
jgi:hypothetical protein